MKKLILFAAAVAAIASCAKVETVSTTGPKLISFKSIDAPMTKALTDELKTPMGVNAMWNHGDGNKTRDVYFSNAQFTEENTSGIWSGKQYWPKTGNLDFIVYAPYNENTTIVYSEDNKSKATLTFPMSDANDNILYGAELYTNKTDKGNITVSLKHATAQVIVNAIAGAADYADLYKITKITFSGITLKGSTVVTYTVGDATHPGVTYTQTAAPTTLSVSPDKTVTETNQEFFSKFIMPFGDQDTFTVEYSVKTGMNTYVPADAITFNLKKEGTTAWTANKKYIFNLTFTADEIKFQPSVDDWTEEVKVPETVEPQA